MALENQETTLPSPLPKHTKFGMDKILGRKLEQSTGIYKDDSLLACMVRLPNCGKLPQVKVGKGEPVASLRL